MPNLRCERFGPFDLEELGEEIGALEFEYMMDLAPSKPPSVVRLCECRDEDYEGYHVRLFVGDYEYCVEEGNEAEDVKAMLEKTLNYETYAEQDLEGVPRFHNWFMALPGKPHRSLARNRTQTHARTQPRRHVRLSPGLTRDGAAAPRSLACLPPCTRRQVAVRQDVRGGVPDPRGGLLQGEGGAQEGGGAHQDAARCGGGRRLQGVHRHPRTLTLTLTRTLTLTLTLTPTNRRRIPRWRRM